MADKSTQFSVVINAMVVLHLSDSVYQARNPSADSRDWPTRWMTLGGGGDAEQLGQPRRASLFLVDQGAFARPQRGASTLLRVTFLVAAAIKITIV